MNIMNYWRCLVNIIQGLNLGWSLYQLAQHSPNLLKYWCKFGEVSAIFLFWGTLQVWRVWQVWEVWQVWKVWQVWQMYMYKLDHCRYNFFSNLPKLYFHEYVIFFKILTKLSLTKLACECPLLENFKIKFLHFWNWCILKEF